MQEKWYDLKQKLINLTSLATVQLSNAILPLVIFPYALGVVGAELYSKLVLSEALSLFLLAIVLYSFEVDGVAQVVGLNLKRDAERISYLLSSIIFIRLLLFIFCTPVVILIAGLFDKQLIAPAIWWSLIPLSYAIQPSWLFQGLERNAPLAVITVLSRISILILVLFMVNNEQDYILVPLTIGSFYLVGAVFSLLYALHVYEIRFVRVPSAQLKAMLWSGKEVFMGNLSVILYRDVNVMILGVLGSPAAGIAAYSMAEKFVKAIQASIRPLNQLFFPKALGLTKTAGTPGRQVFTALLKITWPQVLVLAVLIIALNLTYMYIGSQISWIQRIDNADYVVHLTLIMSAAAVIGVCNFMFGSAGLNSLGERRYYFLAMLSAGLISLALNILLVYVLGSVGAAIGFVLGELMLVVLVVKRYFR